MRPVFIAASPNTQIDDVLLALKQLMTPWSWFSRKQVQKFEKQVAAYHNSQAIAFDSARTSFYLILKAYGISSGDEVILPAFTCLVVANPVIWNGAKPIYVDVDSDFNMDLADLKKKITKKTKAILIQHSFGKPVDIDKVRQLAGRNIKLIEDTAHSLGGEYKGKKLGTLGDATILTFGIEKIISSVRGGMALTNDEELAAKLRIYQSEAKRFSLRRVFVSLLNPVFWWYMTPFYYIGFGKLTFGRGIAWLAHVLGLFGNMIEKEEYRNEKPNWLPAKMPGALATLGMNQFKKLDKFNAHRIEIAEIYSSALNIKYTSEFQVKHVYLRFPLLIKNRAKLLKDSKKRKVVLGDWYKTILYAPAANLHYFGYKKGMARMAEKYAEEIVNLPTGINVSKKAALKIAKLVNKYF